jgi:hypothetical protein
MAAALLAVLPLPGFRFLQRGKMLRARSDPHGFGLSKVKALAMICVIGNDNTPLLPARRMPPHE